MHIKYNFKGELLFWRLHRKWRTLHGRRERCWSGSDSAVQASERGSSSVCVYACVCVCVCVRREGARWNAETQLGYFFIRSRYSRQQHRKGSTARTPAWVRENRDLWISHFVHFTRGGWCREGGARAAERRTCLRRDTLTKTGDWERNRDSLSRSSALSYFICVLFFFSSSSSFPPHACVRGREMFAELLCGAVALVLYVNTLDADFCYDDRYSCWMNDVQLRAASLAGSAGTVYEQRAPEQMAPFITLK